MHKHAGHTLPAYRELTTCHLLATKTLIHDRHCQIRPVSVMQASRNRIREGMALAMAGLAHQARRAGTYDRQLQLHSCPRQKLSNSSGLLVCLSKHVP